MRPAPGSGCRLRWVVGDQIDFGVATPKVGHRAYATRSGVGFGVRWVVGNQIDFGVGTPIVGNRKSTTTSGVGIDVRPKPHSASRRGAKCRDPLRGRDAAIGGLQGDRIDCRVVKYLG